MLCRICSNKELIEIGSLGNIPLSNFTDAPSEGVECPITLAYCKNCTLLQLDRDIPRDLLYKNYWYESHINPVVVKDLKEIAKQALSLTNANGGDIIVDIGSNDSTLLRNYPSKYIRIGCDGAESLWDKGIEGIDALITDYWSYEQFKWAIYKRTQTLAQGENRSIFGGNFTKDESGKNRNNSLERQGKRIGLYLNTSMGIQKIRKGDRQTMRILWGDREKTRMGIYGEGEADKRHIALQKSLRKMSQKSRRSWKYENVGNPKAKIITAIACLYDLPDPNVFIKDIKLALAPNGVFISQLQTLTPMIELNDVGNICHEHLEYYSYKSLVYLFEQNGLEIFKVEENGMNGGSYRLFARHYKNGSVKHKEKEYTIKDLKGFMRRIFKNKYDFLEWVKDKNIVGYGASTKSGVICDYYNFHPEFVVDINPLKIGKYTTYGSKIIGEIPDGTEYLWLFPYGFLDYFKKKEKEYKGKWVVTMPEFKIYD